MAKEFIQRLGTEAGLVLRVGISRKLSLEQKATFVKGSYEFVKSVQNKYDEEERKRIFSAMDLMTKLHLPQDSRPDNTAYISHPLNVASYLVKNMNEKDADIVVAALLHDSVEDQGEQLAKMYAIRTRRTHHLSEKDAALAEIEAEFGSRPRNIVAKVTNPDFDAEVREEMESEGLEVDENSSEFKSRKVRHYQNHFLEITGDKDAFLAKFSDFKDNALTIDKVKNAKKQEKYIGKYGPLIPAVLDKLKDDSLNLTLEEREKMIARFTQAWENMGKPTLN